jgi:hypothetical protein
MNYLWFFVVGLCLGLSLQYMKDWAWKRWGTPGPRKRSRAIPKGTGKPGRPKKAKPGVPAPGPELPME